MGKMNSFVSLLLKFFEFIPLILKAIFATIYAIIYMVIIHPFNFLRINLTDVLFGKWKINYKYNKYYKTPLLTYYSSTLPMYLLILVSSIIYGGFVERSDQFDSMTILILYMIFSVLFVFILYIAMFRRFKKNKANYTRFLELLALHRQFLNLSFLPITFVITIIGFISSWNVPLSFQIIDVLKFLNFIMDGIVALEISGNILLMLLSIFLYLIFMMTLFYLSSIPMQLTSLFINYVFKYFCEYDKEYKNIFIEFYKKGKRFLN